MTARVDGHERPPSVRDGREPLRVPAEPRIEFRNERRLRTKPSRQVIEERAVEWRNDAALWAHDCVWILRPDGTIGPIELCEGQIEYLRAGSAREPHPLGLGRPLHKIVVASRPKRNSKSQDNAILGAHGVVCFTRRTAAVVANSQDQARSTTFEMVADILDLSPALQGIAYYGTLCLDGRLEKRPEVTTIALPGLGNQVRALVPNVRTIQGIGINGPALIEELQAAYSEEAFNLLASQTEAESAQIFIASQAGHRNGALWRLYRAAGNLGGDNPRVWFDYWGDEDARRANRVPWITDEFLDDAQLRMPPWEFAKYHCNLWGSGDQNFLSPDLLDSLFGIDYPLAVYRHHDRRTGSDTGLRRIGREGWLRLLTEMGWTAWTVGIGLDRAMPYAHREGTCVSAVLKTTAPPPPRAAEGQEGDGARAGVPVPRSGGGGGDGMPHFWEIASIDCPSGSQREIDEAVEAIEETIGRRVSARIYESYQSSDIAEDHDADLITPTVARQVRTFNRFHQLTREGRHHCSPQSIGLRAELEEFAVDSSKAHPRFEHPAGGTDDRIYAHAYALEAVVDEVVIARRFGRKPRGM